MSYVCDYAWGRPDPHAIKAAGFIAVCRYLSHDRSGKTLTKPEADALHAAGLGVVLNFEDSAGRALQGGAAGAADAHFANGLADQIGAPADVPIYYSCDTDPRSPVNSSIVDYYAAVHAAGGRPVGVYGGAVLVRQMLGQGFVQFGWTANASSWDHGVPACGHLHQLYSHPAGTPTIAGVDPGAYDTSVVLLENFGAWGLPSPAPTPLPTEELEVSSTANWGGVANSFYVSADGHVWQVVSGREPADICANAGVDPADKFVGPLDAFGEGPDDFRVRGPLVDGTIGDLHYHRGAPKWAASRFTL